MLREVKLNTPLASIAFIKRATLFTEFVSIDTQVHRNVHKIASLDGTLIFISVRKLKSLS